MGWNTDMLHTQKGLCNCTQGLGRPGQEPVNTSVVDKTLKQKDSVIWKIPL